MLKYFLCVGLVLVTLGNVWVRSSLFENLTLYLTNFDLDISSNGSIIHLPPM